MMTISILFEQMLGARWFPFACMTDASPLGEAELRTLALLGELHFEAQFAEKNGWWARLEDAGEKTLSAYENMTDLAYAPHSLVDRPDWGLCDQAWSADFVPLSEFIIIFVHSTPRCRLDLGWWVKHQTLAQAWWTRLISLPSHGGEDTALTRPNVLEDAREMMRKVSRSCDSLAGRAWSFVRTPPPRPGVAAR